MVTGRISFIGAGPGAADLITVRGARRIAEADVVVWSASAVAPECIQEHARSDAELIDSSRLTREEALEIYRRAERDKLKVVRVHSGDPSMWSAVQDQHDVCSRMNVDVEIVPGVAAFSAAAAAVGRELTAPDVAQSLVVTRLEGGRTPTPAGEEVREFAKHGTTMALHLSASRTAQLVEELRAGGYPDDTPVLVAYKVSWPDELLVRTTIGELEKTVKQRKLWRNALFVVGKSLGGSRANSYHFRRAEPVARRPLRPSAPRRRSAEPGAAKPRGTNGVKDSDVAWWAVRDWQESARGAARVAATRSVPRVDAAQSQLFAEEAEPAEAAEPAVSEQPVAVEAAPKSRRTSAASTTTTRATAKATPAKRTATKTAKTTAAKRTKTATAAKAKPAAKRKPAAEPDEQGE
ncbi:precorrin-4 C(11)-methyltransferase [Saccharopolyspora indica]|uniref:precorrin-4 C(11)-methyltransferase n=1 Tax=Saccharopolyspora indica TaxID=1229659 RepID=UPI0022EA5520|nr:precorrin-4 C(11)-methyltransferase [Saccharopolyspora indica]MDA3643583.1 precorrin-4 C(11)-methyltransferase [Saccharopolyspora indica]